MILWDRQRACIYCVEGCFFYSFQFNNRKADWKHSKCAHCFPKNKSTFSHLLLTHSTEVGWKNIIKNHVETLDRITIFLNIKEYELRVLYLKQTNAIQTVRFSFFFADILITALVHRVRAFVLNKEIHLAIAVPNCANIMLNTECTVRFLWLSLPFCCRRCCFFLIY